jgi:MFS family permease
MSTIIVVCVLTFLHHASANMRAPILPLYAATHGATSSAVGLIMGAHMALAASGSIPLGRAADVLGRRPLLIAGMILGIATSLALVFFTGAIGLGTVYGLAGLGIAAFTPSALSLVGDAAPAGKTGQAFAWYSTAHYGAIAIGPFLGGLVAEWWGYRAAFIVSAAGIGVALAVGISLRGGATSAIATRRSVDRAANASVWAGWIVSVSGMLVQGVVFTFFPLLAHERGLTPAGIGLVFLVLGLANTVARVPAGWLVDRTGRRTPYALGGALVAAVATALLPHFTDRASVLGLAAVFGAVSGAGFVAVSVGLAAASTASSRALVMGGYSTSLYLGLALGSFAVGPVIARHGYVVGFTAGAATSVVGTLVAAWLWYRRGSAG